MEKKRTIRRKILHAGGWQAAKRLAKTVPFGGTIVAAALVGSDIKKKGIVRGVINSGLDAIPLLGITKNAIELVTGDLIADKKDRKK